MYIHSLEKNIDFLNTKVFCAIFTHLRHLNRNFSRTHYDHFKPVVYLDVVPSSLLTQAAIIQQVIQMSHCSQSG